MESELCYSDGSGTSEMPFPDCDVDNFFTGLPLVSTRLRLPMSRRGLGWLRRISLNERGQFLCLSKACLRCHALSLKFLVVFAGIERA